MILLTTPIYLSRSPDALQEFSFQTTALGAQYGVHSLATVNIVTKSPKHVSNGRITPDCDSVSLAMLIAFHRLQIPVFHPVQIAFHPTEDMPSEQSNSEQSKYAVRTAMLALSRTTTYDLGAGDPAFIKLRGRLNEQCSPFASWWNTYEVSLGAESKSCSVTCELWVARRCTESPSIPACTCETIAYLRDSS